VYREETCRSDAIPPFLLDVAFANEKEVCDVEGTGIPAAEGYLTAAEGKKAPRAGQGAQKPKEKTWILNSVNEWRI